ncbi:MAG: DUF423 domain-containing protein [Gammaproteobacteria bacterium]|nr:MAG: DUF423 domain-containing protein [Gammaproteobacteria bacterium]
MTRLWGVLAGLSGALAVAIAAWASHGLEHVVAPELLARAAEQARTATLYHLIHTLALLGVALWSRMQSTAWLNLAGFLFATGIACFCLGIYALHLWWPAMGNGGLRYLVPVGGVAFILGWLALAAAALSWPVRRF